MNTILTVDNKLSIWLVNQLNDRNWSHRELGRRAGVSGAAVSRVISGEQNPGVDFCAKIAKALGEPQDKVFRLAGLLPSEPEPVKEEDDLLNTFRQLSPQQRRYALDSLRGLIGQPKPNAAQLTDAEPPEIVIPDRDEGKVPDPEELVDLLKMLDETERYFVYDYIVWRLIEMQRKRNSSGRRRTSEQRKQEHSEAIEIINLMLAIEEADPVRIEQVISWLQRQKSRKEPAHPTEPALSTGR